ncbi:MAG: hypothetical protein B7Z58_01935 [Acidiphilium sp. 37-64-53]|uniref:SdpI family protein n=1 Tax=Acidiphilium TaxID=522 RepID=UPI000BCEC4A1|nr:MULTISPECIES: SdpI family protein [Acidiphilium]OYW03708.1 MAG: hypothetical protein B7Z58_01935 [Acidiphilium sp. 37-64-53]OZB30465.1 MAG: hypothetical protein B7X49_03225 [Acidiphilium sp. 34-64-41]HQT83621.1 SdpI family protein [Acidiphilium rubrum]
MPPNPFYGLRTSRSMADEGLWYQVNAFAGRALTLAALVSVIVAELSPDQWFTWPGFGLCLALTPLAAAALASLLYATTL